MWFVVGLLAMAASADATIRADADAIVASQLSDGAIVHARAGDEISIVPYAGNQAAAGLYEAFRITGDQRYLSAANAWVDWCLERVDVQGRIPEYRGTASDYRPVEPPEWDVPTAASFLQCANMRRILTEDRFFLLREQSKLWKVYEHIAGAVQPDGLLYANADAPYKLTFHNAEAYEGLWQARQIARSLRDYSWNTEIYYARRGIEQAFKRMREEDGLYAWGKSRSNTVEWPEGANAFNTAGLANLAAVACGPASEREAKQTLREIEAKYPELVACTPAQLYWWAAAAFRVDDARLADAAAAALHEQTIGHSPADLGYRIRATVLAEHGERRRFGVPMGSSYISFQRSAFR